MDSIEDYLKLLADRNQACILLEGREILYEADSLGVKPLRMLLAGGFRKKEGQHLILIDRVIGKAALMLAQLIGVDEVYTPLASQKALNYSTVAGIPLKFRELVPFIENRTRTGICPIEQSVLDTEDPLEGEKNIEAVITLLMKRA